MSRSKFTPEVRSALVDRTERGMSLADACRSEGLRLNTVKGWLRRGRREDSGPYAEFAEAIERAREQRTATAPLMDADELANVVAAMARKGSVQAAKLRWEMLRGSNGREPASDEFDELKARRAARGG